jgi:hypothetical protein
MSHLHIVAGLVIYTAQLQALDWPELNIITPGDSHCLTITPGLARGVESLGLKAQAVYAYNVSNCS